MRVPRLFCATRLTTVPFRKESWMRVFSGVLSLMSKPLPGWLTLTLLVGTGAVAASPVFHGSLSVPTGGTITDSNATADSCVTTNTSKQYSYSFCGSTESANTWTANQTLNASLIQQVNGVGNGRDHTFEILNTAPHKPDTADALGSFYAYAPNINTGCSSRQPVSEMWPGISGSTAANYGGYWVFFTKYDGACGGGEVLVLDPQQHIFEPNDTTQFRQSTPGACNAGTTCMTITWTFTKPFLNVDGAAEVPRCSALGIMDETDSTQVWIGNIKTVSSTAVTYNVAPILSTAAAHTLYMYPTCHDQAY